MKTKPAGLHWEGEGGTVQRRQTSPQHEDNRVAVVWSGIEHQQFHRHASIAKSASQPLLDAGIGLAATGLNVTCPAHTILSTTNVSGRTCVKRASGSGVITWFVYRHAANARPIINRTGGRGHAGVGVWKLWARLWRVCDARPHRTRRNGRDTFGTTRTNGHQ